MRDGIVHLVDDDDAVRNSIVFLLESTGRKVTDYASPLAVLDQIRTGPPMSCLVSDVRMPEMDGLELVRQARALDPDLPIVIITGHGDVPLAVQAMKTGAVDFIQKPFDDQVLIDAVAQAFSAGDAENAERAEIRARLDQLSTREREVLQCLVDGDANKVIAYKLGISPRTVEVYRAKAMTKMGAGSFAELVRMAMLAGGKLVPGLSEAGGQ
jgi:two-component system response regulator FixJ